MPKSAQRPCLVAENFSLIPSPPFNRTIRISQATAWFAGRLYVGGGRAPLRDRDAGDDDRLGAEIACYDPAGKTWSVVYSSPLDADGKARDRSVRALAVFQGKGDAEPALYAAVASLRGQVMLLRSRDGELFEECGAPGLGQGDADIAAVRNLCVLHGRLYTSPVGKNKGRGWADDNVAAMPQVLACADPAAADWQAVSEPAFGDPANESVNELIVFNDTLYAATLNRRTGFQLWRAEGLPGEGASWVKVIDQGAWRGPANPVPASMQVFDGALYIGTGVQRQGKEGSDRFGPIAPELIRVWPDDSWELVAGENRATPVGFKAPLSGQGPGFDGPFVQAFWRMAVHDGVLYLGGSDWRFWPSFLPRGRRRRDDISAATQDWLQSETSAWQGDYGLWCSRDGARWEAITTHGLGDGTGQYGIRELLSTPQGLFVVPAATRGGDEGGIEVWLGTPA